VLPTIGIMTDSIEELNKTDKNMNNCRNSFKGSNTYGLWVIK
jgi:hypothetical protein